MTDQEWHTTLEELRAERDRLHDDPELRRELDQLIRDTELHLAQEETHRTPPVERLRAAAERFEATHPKLTLRLNQLLTTLSGSGV